MRRSSMVMLLVVPAFLGMTACAQSRHRGNDDSDAPHASTAWLGVHLQDMTPRLAKEMSLKTESGALVRSVVDDSPADKAGLKEDDVIVEFNGTKIKDSDDLVGAVHDAKPDASADIVVVRADDRKTLKATLGEMPDRELRTMVIPPRTPLPPHTERFEIFGGSGGYGLVLSTLNRQLAEYFGAPNNHGVLVEEVNRKSPAEKAGFKAGDVIIKIGSETVENTDDVYSALEDFKKGDKATFDVIRKGTRTSIALEINAEDWGSTGREFRIFRNNGGSWNLNNDWQFNNNQFRMKMDELGKELRKMGKTLRDDIVGLRARLRQELRSVAGV